MKKLVITLLWAASFSFAHCQPNISGVSYLSSTKLFGLYEIAFQLGDYSNPYDPEIIDVYAEFVAPDGKTLRVNGFYYEGYTFSKQQNYERASSTRDRGWRVRFTPDQTGTWSFSLNAIDKNGATKMSHIGSNRFVFQCRSVQFAEGFISKGNKHFLKRDVVENGVMASRAFYPCGPNIAWYNYYDVYTKPGGIYDYEDYINAIAGSANFLRIWLNRYQYLSLYGPEFTQKTNNKPTVYFDATLNQKDAAELDHIINYAAQHGISIMPCIFTFGDFLKDGTYKHDPSNWMDNPFRTHLGLKSPTDFFTDKEAIRISKNLIRYIVARWGYATNIMAWEFWNEIDNISNGDLDSDLFQRNLVSWHEEMARYTRSIDPFKHPLTTSMVNFKGNKHLGKHLFSPMDIVQYHTYGNIQKAKSNEQRSHQLFNKREDMLDLYPEKPFFVGEFGFGQGASDAKYDDKDPLGFDTRNCLWASLFSTSMGPASFWFWDYLKKHDLLRIYEPVFTFAQKLPLLSDSFSAYHTAETTHRSTIFPNGIQTYYMMNATEDTLYGWCQDTAFSYQALRRLTDKEGKNGHFDDNGVFDPKGYIYTLNPAKRPKPCSRNNEITLPIAKQAVGTQYIVKWYDAETGLEISSEKTTAIVEQRRRNKFITLKFPSSVRDVKRKRINNTYGDAVFSLIRDNGQKEESNATGTAPYKTKKIKAVRPN